MKAPATAKVFAKQGNDASAPVVNTLMPAPDTALRGSMALSATATDNVGVTAIRFEFKTAAAATWTLITSVTPTYSAVAGNYSASYTWNTVAENNGVQISPDGSYLVRAVAVDAAGNAGNLSNTYSIANDPPAKPTGLGVRAQQWALVVYFNAVSGADFDHYNIYRSLKDASVWTLIAETTANAYIDKGLDPSIGYDYKITVVNDLGRESAGTESTGIISDTIAHFSKQQTTKPVIRQITPTNYYFNGTPVDGYTDRG